MNDPQLAPTAAPVTAKKPRAKRPSEIAAALRKELEKKATKPQTVKAKVAKPAKVEAKRWKKAAKKMHAALVKKPKRVKAKKPALRRKKSTSKSAGKPGRPSRYDAAGHARMRKLYATGIALDAVGAKMRPSCTGQCVRHIFIRKGWKLRNTRGKNKK